MLKRICLEYLFRWLTRLWALLINKYVAFYQSLPSRSQMWPQCSILLACGLNKGGADKNTLMKQGVFLIRQMKMNWMHDTRIWIPCCKLAMIWSKRTTLVPRRSNVVLMRLRSSGRTWWNCQITARNVSQRPLTSIRWQNYVWYYQYVELDFKRICLQHLKQLQT